MLKRALEGAGFISAYDRIGMRSTVGVRPPDTARRSGRARDRCQAGTERHRRPDRSTAHGNGYNVSIKVVQAVTGNVIATGERTGVEQRRCAGGGDPADGHRPHGARRRNVGVRSDVCGHGQPVGHVARRGPRTTSRGMEASSNSRHEEARQRFAKALELDPKFGIAYTSLAAASRNLGRPQEAEKYIERSAPLSRRHDRARAVEHARLLLPGRPAIIKAA